MSLPTSDPIVTAVVVTYNRSALLPQTLAALRLQTRLPDRLVVVDNASTDGTDRVLSELVDHHGFAELDVLSMTHNSGGAGGFAAGMRRALELGTDWVWVMDDDVAPDPRCLELLLRHSDASECLHPQRIGHDGRPQAWEPLLSVATGTTTFLDNLSFENGKEVAYTNVACFEGALISSRIIELVGVPDPAYFIIGDDTLFGVKASVHTNLAIVRDAHMRRLLPPGDAKPWKVYYFARNHFLVRTDACAYLGITPTRAQDLVFGLNVVLESTRLVRMGRHYVRPTLRGLRDGLAYARQHPLSSPRRPRADGPLATGRVPPP